MTTATLSLPGSKYAKVGPYHWDAIDSSWKNRLKKYSLTLWARYRAILTAIQGRHQRILEIGCGDGALCHLAAHAGHQVMGFDLDAVAIELALKCSQGQTYPQQAPTFFAEDVATHDFGGQRFDYVIMADVIEHLDHPEAIMQTIQSLVRPGGHLLITTPFRQEGKKWDPLHVFEYTDKDLALFLKRYSSSVKVRTFHPFFLHTLYGNRWARRLLNLLGTFFNPFEWSWPGTRPVMLFASVAFPASDAAPLTESRS